MWDARAASDASPQAVVRYDCGVTSMHCDPHNEHRLCVGSYDESVRLFDTRHMRRAVHSLDVGGGVWRLKWQPSRASSSSSSSSSLSMSRIVAACMHGGFAVLDVAADGALSVGVRWHEPHASLAYGVDWRGDADCEPTKHALVVACCSFYDHLLSVRSIDCR